MVAGIGLVAAPWNIGLCPPAPGREPGTWRAPQVLLDTGLRERLGASSVATVPRPPYEFDPQPGTRMRNGVTMREHALVLARTVRETLGRGQFPLVLGGDCSVLLGCLLGARQFGRTGLLHVDGHSDFRHPGNYDAGRVLGSAAGMDLALATGRGELLLTHWPEVGLPLVADEDVVQVGDREDDEVPPVARFTAQEIGRIGIASLGERVVRGLAERELERVWLHVDLDVLDAKVMPAVDSPGSPGLDFTELTDLVAGLVSSGRVVGMDVAIYDPDLDPHGLYVEPIADFIVTALAPLREVSA